VENNLLRIGQEAIANAVRHAAPTRIAVALEYCADGVRLAIADDGRGPGPVPVPPSPRGGFGLPGMRERAAAMHGTFAFAARPEGGTWVSIEVPHV